mgnify:CR=1 FL=1
MRDILTSLANRLDKLLTIKSIVTLILTVVFAILTCSGRPVGEQFMTIFAMIIAFYYGTQTKKE